MNYGCIGEHLSHSFSKEIHNKIGEYEYITREVEKNSLDEFMTKREFKGINVTIPYKLDVIPYLYYMSDTAKEIGAVNTIVNKDGLLYGYNTDFFGMKALILKTGLNLNYKKVLILGTGGTSKTANAVAKNLGAKEIYCVSRSDKENSLTYEAAYNSYSDAQIIINTTPCGMYPAIDAMPIDLDKFSRLEGVVDAIYNPLRSKLVLSAQKKRLKASGGLYMLVAQAVYAAEKFMGKEYRNEIIDDIYNELMIQKENIVLTGMPGSGKTTVGKIVANELNKKFVDTDEHITNKYKKTPHEIITELGIDAFRNYESEAIKEISANSGYVIATGGGAILRQDNIEFLKQNGKIFFLDRPLEEIVPTDDRPLSSSKAELQKRHEERFDIYCKTADEIIKIKGNAEATSSTIIKIFCKEVTK